MKSDGTVVSTYSESAEEFAEIASWTDITKISAYEDCVLGLKADGTVVAVNTASEADVTEWTDIVDIATSRDQSVGLKSDGTVVFTGKDIKDSFQDMPMSEVISGWTDIKAVYAGDIGIVGLKADGTIVSTGFPKDNLIVITDNGFADSGYHFSDTLQWTGIRVPTSSPAQFLGQQITPITITPQTEISFESAEADITPKSAEFQVLQEANSQSIAAGWFVTAGLRTDGTVAVVSDYDYYDSVADWRNIVSIDAGAFHLVGLKSDGTVIASGGSSDEWLDTEGWTDIVAIRCSDEHVVALKEDGTVIAVGNPYYDHGQLAVSDWTGIKAIAATTFCTFGLKSDGTVVTAGELRSNPYENWSDIADIAASYYFLIGLHSDGTVTTGQTTWDATDVVGITGTIFETIMLKANGSVDYGVWAAPEDYTSPYSVLDQWTDIVAVDASTSAHGYVLGLKSDGTVVVANDAESNVNVSSLTGIRVPVN